MISKLIVVKASVLIFSGMVGTTFGATFAVSNGSGDTAFGIGDSSGDAFQGIEGIVSIGVFSSDDFFNFSSPDFVSNFTSFGTTDDFLAPGPFGNNGIFDLSATATAADEPFVDQPIVAFFGNAATFAEATEFLVLDLGRNFMASDDDITTPIDIAVTDATTVLFGGTVANISTFNGDTSTQQGFITAAPVPEPSSFLLGALGALALLRRKR